MRSSTRACAVAKLTLGDLAGRGREEALVAVALKGVEQAELGTEVRTFPPADEPGSFSPRREVDQLGELCHPGTVSDLVVHLESPASSLPPQHCSPAI